MRKAFQRLCETDNAGETEIPTPLQEETVKFLISFKSCYKAGYCVRLRAFVSSVSVSLCPFLTGARPGFRSGRFRVCGPGTCSSDARRSGHHLVVPRQRLGAKHGGRMVMVVMGHAVVVQVMVI